MVVPISACADHRCSEGAVGRSRAVIAEFAARALLVSSVASSFVVTPVEAGGKVGRVESTVSIALDPKSDTGSAGDGVTRDATPTVFGSAPPKSKVIVRDGGRVIATVTALANGSWRRTVARLAEGTHGLVATMIGAGPSATLAVVVDVNKPAPQRSRSPRPSLPRVRTVKCVTLREWSTLELRPTHRWPVLRRLHADLHSVATDRLQRMEDRSPTAASGRVVHPRTLDPRSSSFAPRLINDISGRAT